jgi:hypothetical protein
LINEVPHLSDEDIGLVWFRKKATVVRQLLIRRSQTPGRYEEKDVGPALVHLAGEVHPVLFAGHLNVGEEQADIVAGFENLEGCRGTGRLENLEPLGLEEAGCMKAQNGLVVDNQDYRMFVVCRSH